MPATRLGVELLATHEIELPIGTFFESWLAAADGTVRRSLGRDEYHLSLQIATGHRLAATGRTYICQFDRAQAEMGENEALPAKPVPLEGAPEEFLLLALRTNRFLALRTLQEETHLQLVGANGARHSLPLNHPSLRCDEVGPGRFLVDLTGCRTH
jgi:hypothetical protein